MKKVKKYKDGGVKKAAKKKRKQVIKSTASKTGKTKRQVRKSLKNPPKMSK